MNKKVRVCKFVPCHLDVVKSVYDKQHGLRPVWVGVKVHITTSHMGALPTEITIYQECFADFISFQADVYLFMVLLLQNKPAYLISQLDGKPTEPNGLLLSVLLKTWSLIPL